MPSSHRRLVLSSLCDIDVEVSTEKTKIRDLLQQESLAIRPQQVLQMLACCKNGDCSTWRGSAASIDCVDGGEMVCGVGAKADKGGETMLFDGAVGTIICATVGVSRVGMGDCETQGVGPVGRTAGVRVAMRGRLVDGVDGNSSFDAVVLAGNCVCGTSSGDGLGANADF